MIKASSPQKLLLPSYFPPQPPPKKKNISQVLTPLKFNGWKIMKAWLTDDFHFGLAFHGKYRAPDSGRMDRKMVPQFFGVVGHSTCGKGFANTQRCTDGPWQCWWRLLEPWRGGMGWWGHFGFHRCFRTYRKVLGMINDNYEGWCDPCSISQIASTMLPRILYIPSCLRCASHYSHFPNSDWWAMLKTRSLLS